MIGTARLTFDIRIVTRVVRHDGGATIFFEEGAPATLPVGHDQFERLRFCAENNIGPHSPIGVVLDGAGRVIDLYHSYQVGVSFVRPDEEDESRLVVALWGFSPICYLTRDHPEFERIRATLEEAAATGGRVRLVNYSQTVDSENETWWKIMDVRPVGSNGAAPVT